MADKSISLSIDESLYSRQLYVLGYDGMTNMVSSDILISGLGGLGVEIAKNILLCGVRSVTLHDDCPCTRTDLSSQYYFSEKDIGKNRALACHQKLSELNTYVKTETSTQTLTESFLLHFRVVVLTNSSLEEQLRISEITRANNIALIIADTRGVFGQVFCDFGRDFLITDPTGECPDPVMVSNITNDAEGAVTCIADTPHGFETGTFVQFSEVEGMTELNKMEPMKIKILNRYSFSIGDTSDFSKYTKGGIVTQVKMPKQIYFKPLKEAIKNPEFVVTDYSKLDHSIQLHLAFQALHHFVLENGRLPKSWNAEDAKMFVSLAEQVQKNSGDEINTNLLTSFSKVCSGNFCPVNSITGGIVAQEILKACTKKFTPVHQWLYFDAVEVLPEDVSTLDCQPSGFRTDGQTAIFGNRFQNKLDDLNFFIVGAGAIGCELLKNFAMMGIGTGKGSVTITDMDMVERSNLSRQFLFRTKDVGKAKSSVAASAIKTMNPLITIIAKEIQTCPETENIFDDRFFESLDGVATALDNVESRAYIDSRCLLYRKPLIESGTMGTKGNVQVIIPFLTESYTSSVDPLEKAIPICTLKNFPSSIEHTLHWACDIFDGLFRVPADRALAYINEKNYIENILSLPGEEPFEILECLKRTLVDERPHSFSDCVEWARTLWEENFSNQIKQLLFTFPPNQTTTTDQPFWSAPKRCPAPLKFNVADSLHTDFIFAAANLRAEMYGIPQMLNREEVAGMVTKVVVPDYEPKTDIRIASSEYQLSSFSDYRKVDNEEKKKLLEEISRVENISDIFIRPLIFEKDNESNFHMDFVTAASNLRATNYNIATADRLKSKLIAGKIVPAIATTTATIAGLACTEIVKLLVSRNIGDFKNAYINLALPLFSFSEPVPAQKFRYNETFWTIWDHFDITGDITLSQFINHFDKNYNLRLMMVTYKDAMIYSSFVSFNKMREYSNMKMTEVVEKITHKKILPHVKSVVFELFCNDVSGMDVDVPVVRYRLP